MSDAARRLSSMLLILCASATPPHGVMLAARARWQEPPRTLHLDGGAALTRVGHATRAELFGSVETYTIALYHDSAAPNPAQLASPESSKALRIDVLYSPEVRPRIVQDWTRELVPPLEAAATAHLRGSFAPLRAGDLVLITYSPDKGTTVRINKGAAVSGANHDLMLAFLDHWVGQTPLSEEIKQRLLGRGGPP